MAVKYIVEIALTLADKRSKRVIKERVTDTLTQGLPGVLYPFKKVTVRKIEVD